MTAYQTDGNGGPLPLSRQMVMTGLAANGGGAIDPVSGDFLFMGGGGWLVALRRGASCGPIVAYGTATPGSAVTPLLAGSGCARLADLVTIRVDGAPLAFGVLAVGFAPASFPVAGVTALVSPDVTFSHQLDATGRLVLPLAIPSAGLGNVHLYFQAGCLDPTIASGFAASRGLDVLVR